MAIQYDSTNIDALINYPYLPSAYAATIHGSSSTGTLSRAL